MLAPDLTTKDDFQLEERTIPVRGLLTAEGIRFIFTSFVTNFQGFGVVAITFIAMMGAGVAEAAGMMSALIRKLVKVAPRNMITFIIVFVGVLTSVATDAGYLIPIPLGAAAFVALRRHPLAGMAAAYAGVSAVFAVNIIFTPVDSMLTEITNEAIGLTGGAPLTMAANYFFMIASSFIIAIVATVVTERIVEPRLGKYVPDAEHANLPDASEQGNLTPAESRGSDSRRDRSPGFHRADPAPLAARRSPTSRFCCDGAQLPSHGQSAFRHNHAVPGRGHRLWKSSWHDENRQ